jgi:hypothetical protein
MPASCRALTMCLNSGPALVPVDRPHTVVGGEEADRVVAPVVAQALLDQEVVVDELVHGQQLDRGDAEPLQVLDRAGWARPA